MKTQKVLTIFRHKISSELSNTLLSGGKKSSTSSVCKNGVAYFNKSKDTESEKGNEVRSSFVQETSGREFTDITLPKQKQSTNDVKRFELSPERDTVLSKESEDMNEGQVVSISGKPEHLESMPKNVVPLQPAYEPQRPYHEVDEKEDDGEMVSKEQFPSSNSDVGISVSPHGCEMLNPDTIFVCDKNVEPIKNATQLKISFSDFFPNATDFGKILGDYSLLGQGPSLSKIQKICVNGIRLQPFATSSVKNDSDQCLPPPLPPKGMPVCEIRRGEGTKCIIREPPKWEGCDKICMPCCCPAMVPPVCNELELRLNTCKRIEYRLPAFSECKKDPIMKPCPKECCYYKMICPKTVVDKGFEPLIRTKIRQAWILGRRTNMDDYKSFSTSARFSAKDDDKCKKTGSLPCLKASEVVGSKKKVSNRKACEKFCMPCCAPARDPPDCYHPYVKAECKKLRPPRPSYSECKKEELKSPTPCECLIPRPPPCDRNKSEGPRGCGAAAD